MSDTTMDGFDRCSCDESQALRAEVERLTKELAAERADKGLIRADLTARAEGAEARAEQMMAGQRLRASIVAERAEIKAEGRRMERLVDGMKDLIDRFENPLSKPETVPYTAAEAWVSTVARLRRELEEAKKALVEQRADDEDKTDYVQMHDNLIAELRPIYDEHKIDGDPSDGAWVADDYAEWVADTLVPRLRRELAEAKASLAEVVAAKQSTDDSVCEACDILRGVSSINVTLVELARVVAREVRTLRKQISYEVDAR